MHVMNTKQSDTKMTHCRWNRNLLPVLVSNDQTMEAIRRADAEAEKAVKRAKMLEERRAAKRASATPMDELEESATNAEVTAESLMIAAEAILTETRENS